MKGVYMEQLEALYQRAIENTKKLVDEDIVRYLGSQEVMPSFEQYVRERGPFITQLWLNVWLNLTNSHLSKAEKKFYLSEAGFEVDGMAKKLINDLFRTEMRSYQSFDVLEWLEETYAHKIELWKERYEKARAAYLIEEEERRRRDRMKKMRRKLEREIHKLLQQNEDKLYIWIRYQIAVQIEKDVNRTGYVPSSKFINIETFLEELTEPPYQTFHWRQNHYFEKYERIIYKQLFDYAPKLIKNALSHQIFNQFRETFNQTLTEKLLKEMLEEILFDLAIDFFEYLVEEYYSDLVKLAEIPFDEAVHLARYQQDVASREQKIEEEKAEIRRKQEEEARMIEDIFGREYHTSTIRNIQYVLHIGETNTGKTFHALEKMKAAESGLYLAPLRLLALEVYDKLNSEATPCSLKTGEEEKIITGANHISCTVEMFHEKDYYDVVVIDEAQMIADKDRGFSWYKAITKANAREVHIIGSRNVKELLLSLLEDAPVEINEYSRDIPLEIESNTFTLKHSKKGDALVCFSRRRVLETAAILQSYGHSVSMIYGSMPPETRKKQIERFINGDTRVIVATDAIGMGLNLPIRRIVFLENEKFDGTRRRRLTSQEVKQIAGRAGRKGIYNIGKVAFTSDIKHMSKLLQQPDEPLEVFTIAPTNSVFERFQKYSRDLGKFFELWEKFEGPRGTKKASLAEERELYEMIRGTMIEARFSLMDLYGFLHLPFSSKEPELKEQWKEKIKAIVEKRELPEPNISKDSLEELELSYKSIGLHLLFLYKLDKKTEALYWERVREEISDAIHEVLKSDMKHLQKKCKKCGKILPKSFRYQICNECHQERYYNKRYYIR
ncbi:MAG TPA: helicase-related protein [Bacillus sp. (in: firmicutes)]|nr:helicase-related protein [Bacillus sp. (in: firmicutes)]